MSLETPVNDKEALADRVFGATIAALELLSIHLGSRLGLYRTLVDEGPLTSGALARAAGIAERYAQEWCEQQAVAALIEVDDPGLDPSERRYHLTADQAAVLAEPDDPAHVAPLAASVVGSARVMREVEHAYRTGGGVPYHLYGEEFRDGQGGANRPAFTHDLPNEWLPAMPDVHARLRQPGARVAEIGSGQGYAAAAIARAYPHATVDAYDLDEASIADTRRTAEAAGVADRVHAAVQDASSLDADGVFDLVVVLETLHDIARPVETLSALRRALKPSGSVFVADEKVADRFTAPGDEVERLMYGWSVVHCLPTQLVDVPSAATGTVMRASTVREHAAAAGFSATEDVAAENPVFRFYRLRP